MSDASLDVTGTFSFAVAGAMVCEQVISNLAVGD